MSLSLDGLRHLMRRSAGLPTNMSETEIRHYSSQVMRRLQRGEGVEPLKLYLRGIDTTSAGRLPISASTHDLAQEAHMQFHKSADAPVRK
jgi:hypothetical protein